jgi:hypothetical protein
VYNFRKEVHSVVGDLSVMSWLDRRPRKPVHYSRFIRSLFTQWKKLMGDAPIHNPKFTAVWKRAAGEHSASNFDVNKESRCVNNCTLFARMKTGRCIIH